jgi:hypothetical protein
MWETSKERNRERIFFEEKTEKEILRIEGHWTNWSPHQNQKVSKKVIQLKEQIMIQQKEQKRLGQKSEKKEQNFQTQQEFIFESNFCDQLVIHYLNLSLLKKIIGMSKTSFKKLEN